MELITETESYYKNLQELSLEEILSSINKEDQTVPLAVAKAMPQIKALATAIVEKMGRGGRLFYIGAGTSGRLGILDASECPPTFGVPYDLVVGLIAGGDTAIKKAVENAEDDPGMDRPATISNRRKRRTRRHRRLRYDAICIGGIEDRHRA